MTNELKYYSMTGLDKKKSDNNKGKKCNLSLTFQYQNSFSLALTELCKFSPYIYTCAYNVCVCAYVHISTYISIYRVCVCVFSV